MGFRLILKTWNKFHLIFVKNRGNPHFSHDIMRILSLEVQSLVWHRISSYDDRPRNVVTTVCGVD